MQEGKGDAVDNQLHARNRAVFWEYDQKKKRADYRACLCRYKEAVREGTAEFYYDGRYSCGGMNYQLILSKRVELTEKEIEREKRMHGYNFEPSTWRDETVLTVELTEEQWNRVRNAVLKEV